MQSALPLPLRSGRVHEVYGASATSFALCHAAQGGADVLWVRLQHAVAQLTPAGFAGLDPARLLIAQTRSHTETLAVAEDALRSGAAPFVVAEPGEPVDLTAGRRLQLAAAAGHATGLCLIAEGAGSNAAETRWHCTPVFDADDSTLQRWELKKNKSGTLGSWHVRWNPEARRIAVVSPARK